MDKWSTSDDEDGQLMAPLRPDTLGQVFGSMAVVGGGSFLLSFFSVFGYVILFTPPDGSPLPLPIVAVGIGSWTCVVVALWGYVIWVTMNLRNQPQDSDRSLRWNAETPNQSEQQRRKGFQLLWHTGDRDLSEQRRRWRFLALGFGVIALFAPVAMVAGSA